MRTTVTLDDDVAAKLKAEIARTGSTFKEAINSLLRASLNATAKPNKPKRFKVRARSIGVRMGYENVWAFIDELDEVEGKKTR